MYRECHFKCIPFQQAGNQIVFLFQKKLRNLCLKLFFVKLIAQFLQSICQNNFLCFQKFKFVFCIIFFQNLNGLFCIFPGNIITINGCILTKLLTHCFIHKKDRHHAAIGKKQRKNNYDHFKNFSFFHKQSLYKKQIIYTHNHYRKFTLR